MPLNKYYQHMNYSFEYIDIILLAMIAGFIFLRLRGILGKKTGYEEDVTTSFPHDFPQNAKQRKVCNKLRKFSTTWFESVCVRVIIK